VDTIAEIPTPTVKNENAVLAVGPSAREIKNTVTKTDNSFFARLMRMFKN